MDRKQNSDTKGKEPPVVEGEILGERKSAQAPGAGPAKSATSGRWRRTPWYLALVLAIFVGGLFAGPWVEGTLRQLFPGLMPPQTDFNDQIRQLSARQDGFATQLEHLSSQDAVTGIDPSVLSARLDPIIAHMQEIDARLLRLESAEATRPSGPSEGQNSDLLAQIAQIKSRLDQLDSAQASAGAGTAVMAAPPAIGRDEGRINQLEMRLGLLEAAIDVMQQKNPAQAESSTLLPVAFVALARDMEMARPYENRLRDIRAVLVDRPAYLRAALEPELIQLERSAATGIVAPDTLRDRFSPIIAGILKSNAINAETTWWGRAWAELKGTITVRPIGDAEGPDLAASLARAEFALAQGDVASALGIITAIDGPHPTELEDWSAEARAYVDAQAALDRAMAVLLDQQRGD